MAGQMARLPNAKRLAAFLFFHLKDLIDCNALACTYPPSPLSFSPSTHPSPSPPPHDRYQYVNLVNFIENGQWGGPDPQLENEFQWGGWSPFYEVTAKKGKGGREEGEEEVTSFPFPNRGRSSKPQTYILITNLFSLSLLISFLPLSRAPMQGSTAGKCATATAWSPPLAEGTLRIATTTTRNPTCGSLSSSGFEGRPAT